MEMTSLEIKVPSDLLALLRVSQDQMTQDVQHWIALELFQSRKISAGKAAEVAGVPLAEFMDLTRQHDIAWVEYTDEALEVEVREALALGKVAQQGRL